MSSVWPQRPRVREVAVGAASAQPPTLFPAAPPALAAYRRAAAQSIPRLRSGTDYRRTDVHPCGRSMLASARARLWCELPSGQRRLGIPAPIRGYRASPSGFDIGRDTT